MGGIVQVLKVRRNRRLSGELNIRNSPHHILINIGRNFLVNHDCSVKPTTHLLIGRDMGVVPVGARIRKTKLVEEILAGLNGSLGDSGHTIHRVGQTDAMPMNR